MGIFGFEDGFVITFSRMEKLYKKMCFDAVADYVQFTPNEILVMMFLSNEDNAPFDTATDIANYRNISKSLVTRSVDSLCQKGFLVQERDKHDRRQIHLRLTPQSCDIVKRLHSCRKAFDDQIKTGISDEDRKTMERVNRIIENNLNEMLRRHEEL